MIYKIKMAAIKFIFIGLLVLILLLGWPLEDHHHGAEAARVKKDKKPKATNEQLIEKYYVKDSIVEAAIQTGNWTSPIAPPPLYVPLSTPVGRRQADTLRNLLARDAVRNPTQYDPRDVQAVVNGSLWHVTRFMVRMDAVEQKSNSEALVPLRDSWERMQTNLKWRQTIAINEDNPTAVWPCEFWLVGIIHVTVPRQQDPRQPGGYQLMPVLKFVKEGSYEGKLGREWFRFIQWQYDRLDRWAGWYDWPVMVTFNGLNWSTMPSSGMLMEDATTGDHFVGKLTHVYADRSSLSESIAGNMVGSSLDVLAYASPDRTRNSVHWIRNAIDLYKIIKKRDLPISVGGTRLPVSESLFSEVYARQEKVDSPLKTCTPLERLMAQDAGWPRSEVDKFLSNNQAIIEYMRKQLNIV